MVQAAFSDFDLNVLNVAYVTAPDVPLASGRDVH